MTVKRENLTLDMYYASETENGDKVAKITIVLRDNASGEEVHTSTLTRTGEATKGKYGTVAKLAMRQPFVLFKGLTFQKLCLPGAFRPGDHHNKMLRPGLCVMHASPQYL